MSCPSRAPRSRAGSHHPSHFPRLRGASLFVFPALILPLVFAACKGESTSSPVALGCHADSSVRLMTKQSLPAPASIAKLTQEVLLLADSHAKGTTLKHRIQERSQALVTLLRSDPELVLRTALSSVHSRRIPTEHRACIEQRLTLEGTLEALVVDSKDAHSFHFTLTEESGAKYALYFSREYPRLETGSRIRATGVLLPCGGVAQPHRTGTSLKPFVVEEVSPVGLTAVVPRTFGAQSTAVILVGFQDKPCPYTVADSNRVVFGEVSDYFKEASFQQTWLTGSTFGPYNLALSSKTCSPDSLAAAAKTAARNAGVDLSRYSKYMYVFPSSACGWLGLGYIGGNPSESWINGSFTMFTVAHELGHNLGLYHSNAQSCGTSTLGSSCSTIEYGDTGDVMGNRVPAHFNAFQKERLGWLGYDRSPPITTVTTSGTYFLEPYAAQTSGVKALKVKKSADSFYYLEYRQPVGYDATFASIGYSNNLTRGLLVHTGSTTNANSSLLLNMNAQTSSWYQAALNVGQLFTDSLAKATLSLVSIVTGASGGATVDVSIDGAPPTCARAAPTVTLSPSQSAWVAPGTPVPYTVTIQNNDNANCTATEFSVATTLPPGFAGSGGTSVNVAPGRSGTSMIELQSSATAQPGDYAFGVQTGSSAGNIHTATAQGSYLVAQPVGPSVSLFADRDRYLGGEEMSVSVRVALNGEPATGLPFVVQLHYPDGSMGEHSGTTDAEGTATWSYRFGECAPEGEYRIVLSAEADGKTAQEEKVVRYSRKL